MSQAGLEARFVFPRTARRGFHHRLEALIVGIPPTHAVLGFIALLVVPSATLLLARQASAQALANETPMNLAVMLLQSIPSERKVRRAYRRRGFSRRPTMDTVRSAANHGKRNR